MSELKIAAEQRPALIESGAVGKPAFDCVAFALRHPFKRMLRVVRDHAEPNGHFVVAVRSIIFCETDILYIL